MKKLLFLLAATTLMFGLSGRSVFADYGSSSNNNNNSSTSMPSAPQCSEDTPDAPTLFQPSNVNGKAVLRWSKSSNADHYVIAYGLSQRNYIYGVPNTGDVTEYTVEALTSGKYFFAVQAVNKCKPSAFSNEWAYSPSRGFIASFPGLVLAASTSKTSAAAAPSATPIPTIQREPTAQVVTTTPLAMAPVNESLWTKIVHFFRGVFGLDSE